MINLMFRMNSSLKGYLLSCSKCILVLAFLCIRRRWLGKLDITQQFLWRCVSSWRFCAGTRWKTCMLTAFLTSRTENCSVAQLPQQTPARLSPGSISGGLLSPAWAQAQVPGSTQCFLRALGPLRSSHLEKELKGGGMGDQGGRGGQTQGTHEKEVLEDVLSKL